MDIGDNTDKAQAFFVPHATKLFWSFVFNGRATFLHALKFITQKTLIDTIAVKNWLFRVFGACRNRSPGTRQTPHPIGTLC